MANVPINGATLRWAREVMFVEQGELARAADVKPERIAEFEEGDAPTFRQLTLMAKKLDRPLGFFFAPPPAEADVPSTADFRGGTIDEVPPHRGAGMSHYTLDSNIAVDGYGPLHGPFFT